METIHDEWVCECNACNTFWEEEYSLTDESKVSEDYDYESEYLLEQTFNQSNRRV
jgi:hypothetical protein